jgi:hypothetical protein
MRRAPAALFVQHSSNDPERYASGEHVSGNLVSSGSDHRHNAFIDGYCHGAISSRTAFIFHDASYTMLKLKHRKEVPYLSCPN